VARAIRELETLPLPELQPDVKPWGIPEPQRLPGGVRSGPSSGKRLVVVLDRDGRAAGATDGSSRTVLGPRHLDQCDFLDRAGAAANRLWGLFGFGQVTYAARPPVQTAGQSVADPGCAGYNLATVTGVRVADPKREVGRFACPA
jgi:hypothetical protein